MAMRQSVAEKKKKKRKKKKEERKKEKREEKEKDEGVGWGGGEGGVVHIYFLWGISLRSFTHCIMIVFHKFFYLFVPVSVSLVWLESHILVART